LFRLASGVQFRGQPQGLQPYGIRSGKNWRREMQSVWMEQLVGRNAGNYQIDRLFGRGPVSSFYEARHISGQSAMFTLFNLPETFSPQARARFLARFRQECAALVQLKHSAILPVLDYGEFGGFLYLATPLVAGNSLAQILQARGPMPYELVLAVLKQIAEGLDYAHSTKVVHGALCPASILANNGRGETQIAGFGIAHILALQGLEPQVPRHAHQLSVTGTFLGRPDYMAPEIVLGEPFSASADIFALGVLLFELLSGQPPFSAATPFDVAEQYLLLPMPRLSARVPALPASVDAVMRKALAYAPEQRYQSAGELVRAFEQALQPEQVDGQPSNLPISPAQNAARGAAGKQPDAALIGMLQTALPGLDPFAWWSSASMIQVGGRPQTGSRVAGGRRRAVALLSIGAMVVAGAGGGGFALEHYLQVRNKTRQVAQVQSQSGPQVASPTVQPTATMATTPTQRQPTATVTAQPTIKPSATAQSATPTPVPTSAPTPTPTPTPASPPSSSSKGKGKKKGGKKG
jgi:serine/threonine protein kinase